ncbi:tripartite tricarboxylate transporter substrate-binding protein [Roseomonas sp. NAR14]|uniref:Tripartite tricarboxylate transporter substrate-binding protein n=1 Tax=Roseomonas acroporae TaxID=2937791 RepID=A0A9X1Y766_9PROT|nr:tripartite tricarboxylate transporter substrate-binding protein [Roseomonas acroporae]MCK8783455.1 tripartite tricarboxylate transporter substrate-binding protein [Roseomonas acroporae]
MSHSTRRAALLGALALPALAGTARAETWPARPIRLIVPFAPGGAGDSAARAIAPRWGELLGQNIVVENRTGGSGTVGGAAVATAPHDGYTLLWDASSHIVNPSLLRGLSFDYATAFAPISLGVTFPQALSVKKDFPAGDLAAFVAAAKARPGTISVGTQGNATAGHIALVTFMRRAGVDLVHVPYRGGAEAARDLAAGTVDAAFCTVLSAGPIVDSGRARMLAVSTPGRVALRPDVPTLAELGFPGFDISEWNALFAPAGTPAPVIARLHATLVEALADAGVRERLARLAAIPVGSAPDAFATYVREGREQMGRLVREAGITAN